MYCSIVLVKHLVLLLSAVILSSIQCSLHNITSKYGKHLGGRYEKLKLAHWRVRLRESIALLLSKMPCTKVTAVTGARGEGGEGCSYQL